MLMMMMMMTTMKKTTTTLLLAHANADCCVNTVDEKITTATNLVNV